MNTSTQALHQSDMNHQHKQPEHHNQVIEAMLGCAQVTVERLHAMGIVILAVTVHGSKPVIDIVPGPQAHRFTMMNSSDWSTHMGTCPASKRKFIQIFVNFGGCLVTWIKWG